MKISNYVADKSTATFAKKRNRVGILKAININCSTIKLSNTQQNILINNETTKNSKHVAFLFLVLNCFIKTH